VLTMLLEQDVPDQREIPCKCGGAAKYIEMRRRKVLTAVGEAEVLRAYYVCADCRKGQAPFDTELDIDGYQASPGVRRMAAMVGSQCAFGAGRKQIKLLADLEITAKSIERYSEGIGADIGKREGDYCTAVMGPKPPEVHAEPIATMYVEMDATGTPMVPKELEGRVGKNGDRAKGRDTKLGCVFTQTTFDEKGRPVRDEDSTTYIGGIETAEKFGRRIYSEAYRRGSAFANRLVVLGDGAPWIWILAALHFPSAIQIVDLFHARKHLWDLSAILFSDPKDRAPWVKRAQRKLDAGRIEDLVAYLRSIPAPDDLTAKHLRIEANYFRRNASRMRYADFKRQGLFVGSGVIEAGCKTVIGARLKQSGMFWTVRGADSIINLRCCIVSDKFEDYWTARLAA
jgi:hypothetical protein